jgi:hypothetical protein
MFVGVGVNVVDPAARHATEPHTSAATSQQSTVAQATKLHHHDSHPRPYLSTSILSLRLNGRM